jgi:Nucleotidyltransferase/DNA polymerase involved in DNA repair
MSQQKQYIAIDLKSFYASVEAVERGLDPLDVNLVVADESRSDKTICLAVSPALKALGVPGRARLFEAKQRMREVNALRRGALYGRSFTGKSAFASELAADPGLELDCIVATPRMSHYMDYSRRIVEIYLRYVSMEDLLVYSIDEVFIDATHYLKTSGMTAHEFARTMIRDVLRETHITATAGVGTNLYLAKIAMDIMAKHIPADEDGVRIAELDERTYREQLWCHRPLTDFWRVGRGIARKLEQYGLHTMGDIARCSEGPANSVHNEDLLYRLFGVNAELLIDHAWGWEPTEIADCKAYVPESKSLSQGQVLTSPYTADKGRLIVQEMADQLSMDLVRKGLCTDQIVVDVSYDVDNLKGDNAAKFHGEIVIDRYGRQAPKGVHGSQNLDRPTASTKKIVDAATAIYDRVVDTSLLVRRFNIAAVHLIPQSEVDSGEPEYEQLNLFTDYEARDRKRAAEQAELAKETKVQKALLNIRDRYGRNAIVRGLNLKEGATGIDRNGQIGGHKA